MADVDAMREMLMRAGVRFDDEMVHDLDPTSRASYYGLQAGATRCLLIYADSVDCKNLGFPGFFTVLFFDAAGALVSVGTWE